MDDMEIERRITKRALADLIRAGFTISVNDGEETTVKQSTDTAVILEAMWSTDEDYLLVHRDNCERAFGWVRMIHGNGRDVLSDYTVNLEQWLQGANALAETLDA